jgi:hypothetical protein
MIFVLIGVQYLKTLKSFNLPSFDHVKLIITKIKMNRHSFSPCLDMPSSKRVRTTQDFNSAAVIEATGFPSPERCRRCTLNNTRCTVSSDVYRCSQCTLLHLSCSLVSNKRFNVACEAYRSLAREISGARRRIQEAIAHLDVLERKWEHSVEHGLSRNCQSKVTSSCELLLSMNVANILS